MMTRLLDLGCGKRPRNWFDAQQVCGVDLFDDPVLHIKKSDLALEPIPFPDAFFDYVTAFDFIEHIPRVIFLPQRRNAFVVLMNEIYRVLKVGGLFYQSTPAFPKESSFVDPTHVNFITENTFLMYFDDFFKWAGIYGFEGSFKVIGSEWQGHHIKVTMQKVMCFQD